MKPDPQHDLTPYLARLRAIPFVTDAQPAAVKHQVGRPQWDAAVEIRLDRRARRYLVELKRTPRLDHALVTALRHRLIHTNARWILFTPFVTPPMAEHLQKLGINFVDLAGNCHLVVDQGHVAIIQGRRPPIQAEDTRALGPSGFRVLFTFLARPEMLRATVREVAAAAGVGKTAAAATRARLIRTGLLGRTRARAFILRPKDALDRWIAGYREVLRPRLLLGCYETPERDPLELERRIERILALPDAHETDGRMVPRPAPTAPRRWAWGGTTAAYRLTGHYRGEDTVLHVDRPVPEQQLRVLPASDGNLAILRVPAPLALDGARPGTAHPLLVYTELLMTNDDRVGEAAAEIFERFLSYLDLR